MWLCSLKQDRRAQREELFVAADKPFPLSIRRGSMVQVQQGSNTGHKPEFTPGYDFVRVTRQTGLR